MEGVRSSQAMSYSAKLQQESVWKLLGEEFVNQHDGLERSSSLRRQRNRIAVSSKPTSCLPGI